MAVTSAKKNVSWLILVGLCIFTFAVVTFYLPVGDLGIVIATVGMALQITQVRIPRPFLYFGAFVAWSFVASFAAPFPEIARLEVVERTKLLAIFLIATNALRTSGQLRIFLWFFLACFILFPVRGALLNFLNGYNLFGRAIWNFTFANPNDLAALSLITFGIALGLLSTKLTGTIARIAASIGALLLLLVIFLTQSRGAIIGLVFGTTIAFGRACLKRPSLIVPALIIGLLFGHLLPEGLWERLSGLENLTNVSTIAEADAEGSAAERLEIQQVALRIFLDNPIFGVGLGAYGESNALYAPHLGRKDTHNTYLSLAAEVGLPGLILWCATFVSALLFGYRARKSASSNSLANQQVWIERGMWGFLVAGIFGSYGALTFPYLILAAIWCSATLLSHNSQNASGVTINGDH